MQNNIKKGLIISGVFAAEVPDKASELISIDGMSIEELNSGKSLLNSEHNSGKFSDYLGRIISAKKIFKDSDCSNDFERKCFENAGKNAIIFGSCELFDDQEGHTEAQHAAAVIKAYKRKGIPIAAAFSIEGASVDKQGPLIKRSIAKQVALTIRPCNQACELDIVSELSKSEKETYEKLQKISNSINPNLLSISPSHDIQVTEPIDLHKNLNDLSQKLQQLNKALSAGFATGSPGTLTQGEALQGKKPVKKEESSTSSSESTTQVSEELIIPMDKDKVEDVDEKGKKLVIDKIKLKKAEIFTIKTLTYLKKNC